MRLATRSVGWVGRSVDGWMALWTVSSLAAELVWLEKRLVITRYGATSLRTSSSIPLTPSEPLVRFVSMCVRPSVRRSPGRPFA